MKREKAKDFVADILAQIDIRIGGDRPWDIQVHNDELYSRVLAEGSLGLGESYMERWWDCERLDEFFFRVIRNDLKQHIKMGWSTIILMLLEKLTNRQAKGRRAEEVGRKHYDTGNDLFEAMLDKRMVYSCGYWEGADNLDDAQENKLDLVCRKLNLEPGMRVLDIGCGWGSFAGFAAEKYGVNVVGINNSKEQVALASKRYEGLPVEIRFQDYRDVKGTFERIVSIGMFEHVGPHNYRTFMQVVDNLMIDDGLCLLHTIGTKMPNNKPDAWSDKYIFPGGILPTVSQMSSAMEGLLMVEDWHNFGNDYVTTLLAWHKNFEDAWPALEEKYGDRLYRMWRYYLLSMAGAFRSRSNQLWQVVMAKDGLLGGYKSVR
ncbi:MAG: cyclopropane fatty acyl phospholipid synthase [Rhodothermia bacterium]